jgi:predicted transcriptional regulator
LRNEGLLVNVHLVYTLQQAYMAMHAGATYVCPLVGRLQDQGHDALDLVAQIVDAVNDYGYDTKVMFSSVRNVEHVRNALNLGVHTITVPLKILKQLTENHFTTVGTDQFIHDTRLMTVKVGEAINGINPLVSADATLVDAIIKMTEFGFGAITIVNADGSLKGVFTDGDLRRKIQTEGRDVLGKKMGDFTYTDAKSVEAGALLNDAAQILKTTKVDTLLVTENGKPIGMLDIQDLEA